MVLEFTHRLATNQDFFDFQLVSTLFTAQTTQVIIDLNVPRRTLPVDSSRNVPLRLLLTHRRKTKLPVPDNYIRTLQVKMTF